MNTFTPSDILVDYRQLAEEQERTALHPKASFSKDHQRKIFEQPDYRLPYKRDVDRIVHSKAYARYGDKTQVVYLVENDHISHRSLHVQLVSSFARGIAEILRLNLDLVEAISLGHDIGHAPFGHEGEHYLSDLSVQFGGTPFTHSLQSVRLSTIIEPLNLGLAVYDGFLCHDGGVASPHYKPSFGKTWEDFDRECKEKIQDPNKNIWPGTLEGCLVKLCDTISYLGKDIEDAIQIGILERSQIPSTLLGKDNRQILAALARDLIQTSYDQDYIGISQEGFEAMKELRNFNFRNIYIHPKLKRESKKIKTAYRILFETLLEDWDKQREKSYLWLHFLHNKSEEYLNTTDSIQRVVDYISGMTDSYFLRTLQTLVIPRQIEL